MAGVTAAGHVLPGLAVIRELVRRGHRVTYAVGDALAPLVAATGAEPVPCSTTLPGAEGWPEDTVAGLARFIDEGIAQLPQLLAAYGDDPPDLVLHDTGAIAGPVAAARWGVPAVQLSPTFVAWQGWERDPDDPLAALRGTPALARLDDAVAAWLAECGVDLRPADLVRSARAVVVVPRAMQPHPERVAPGVTFAGACFDEGRLADDDWRPPAGAASVAYVAFGTAYAAAAGIHRACIAALAGRFHVVIGGVRSDPAALGPLPAGVELHRSVPQLAVLRHARVFVTHAGMGSTMEALWRGVPTVAIPRSMDQFANAARLEAIGAGVCLGVADATPAALRAAVERVTSDPGIAARVAALMDEVRSEGGAGAAADAIEAALAGG
jgi:MGT family glycosyltransferase